MLANVKAKTPLVSEAAPVLGGARGSPGLRSLAVAPRVVTVDKEERVARITAATVTTKAAAAAAAATTTQNLQVVGIGIVEGKSEVGRPQRQERWLARLRGTRDPNHRTPRISRGEGYACNVEGWGCRPRRHSTYLVTWGVGGRGARYVLCRRSAGVLLLAAYPFRDGKQYRSGACGWRYLLTILKRGGSF